MSEWCHSPSSRPLFLIRASQHRPTGHGVVRRPELALKFGQRDNVHASAAARLANEVTLPPIPSKSHALIYADMERPSRYRMLEVQL